MFLRLVLLLPAAVSLARMRRFPAATVGGLADLGRILLLDRTHVIAVRPIPWERGYVDEIAFGRVVEAWLGPAVVSGCRGDRESPAADQ